LKIEDTHKKVGRKPKESDLITNDDLKNLEDGITTNKEIADRHGIKRQTVDNKVHRKKLKLSFQNKSADPNISKESIDSPQVLTSPQTTEQVEAQGGGVSAVPIDATPALKGMWQFVDTMLVMASTLSKGSIEYDKLTDEELDRLATVCNQSPFMRKLALQEGLSGLIIVGTIIGTFGSHIKFKLKKRHKKNDINCMCDDCKKLRVLEKKLKETTESEVLKKEAINNVPITAFKEPKTIEKRAEEIKDTILDQNKENDQYLRNKLVDSNTFNATDEYKLPD